MLLINIYACALSKTWRKSIQFTSGLIRDFSLNCSERKVKCIKKLQQLLDKREKKINEMKKNNRVQNRKHFPMILFAWTNERSLCVLISLSIIFHAYELAHFIKIKGLKLSVFLFSLPFHPFSFAYESFHSCTKYRVHFAVNCWVFTSHFFFFFPRPA